MVKEVFLDLDLEEPKESLTRKVAVGQEQVSSGAAARVLRARRVGRAAARPGAGLRSALMWARSNRGTR